MASTPTSLIRSRSAPQPISALAPEASSKRKPTIQRSSSHVDVEKDSNTKRRVAAQTTKSRQGPYAHPQAIGDPFHLSGFFPTSLSAIGSEEEWGWVHEEGQEEGSVQGGRSAIFGEETSEMILREDKLGVLALKDVSLFAPSAGETLQQEGRLLSPYASDDVVDEHSLYLAQRARRESNMEAGIAAGTKYGEVFFGSHVP